MGMTAQAPLKGRIVVAALAVLLVLGWLAWWSTKRIMWWTPTGHVIARVVRGAVAVNETLLTPPQAYRNVPITAAEMSRLEHLANRKLAGYYAGTPLREWRQVAQRVLNPRDLHAGKTSSWMVIWRVDWVHLGELTLLPGSATATASAEFRSSGGVINRVDYTEHLVRTSHGWRIDREDSEFEPGYGP